jgi:hypothetical protein
MLLQAAVHRQSRANIIVKSNRPLAPQALFQHADDLADVPQGDRPDAASGERHILVRAENANTPMGRSVTDDADDADERRCPVGARAVHWTTTTMTPEPVWPGSGW